MFLRQIMANRAHQSLNNPLLVLLWSKTVLQVIGFLLPYWILYGNYRSARHITLDGNLTYLSRPRNVSTLLRHFGNLFYCSCVAPSATDARSFSGGLIQADSGRAGCLGGWRTKRSGC